MSEKRQNQEYEFFDIGQPSLYSIEWEMARCDQRLSRTERDLLMEINQLTRSCGFCWANNSYLEERMRCCTRTITSALKNLTNFDYIHIVYFKDKEKNNFLSRHIYSDKNVPGFPKEKSTTIKTTPKEYSDKFNPYSRKLLDPPYSRKLLYPIAESCSNSNSNNNNIKTNTTGSATPGVLCPRRSKNSKEQIKNSLPQAEALPPPLPQKDKKEEDLFLDLIPETLKGEKFAEKWKEWITYKKERRNKMTKSTARMQLKGLAQCSLDEAIARIDQSIMNGWIGLFESKKNNNSQSSVPTKENLFKCARDQAILDSLIEMVSDNVVHETEKEDALADIVEQVLDWERPSMDNVVDGRRRGGMANYHPVWTSDARECYQKHIKAYSARSKMPICVKMIRIGSECWQAFEKRVSDNWSYMDEKEIAAYLKNNA